MSFTLLTIQATPDFATKSSAGLVIPPNVQSQIWAPPNQNYIDGDGSIAPVTFKTPASWTEYTLPVTINGACTFTDLGYSNQKYSITASLNINGQTYPVLVANNQLCPVLKNPPTIQINCSQFQIDPAFSIPTNCAAPFRIAGDFSWKISAPNLQDQNCPTPTRLELSFARTEAPSGPWTLQNSNSRTLVNYQGTYPVYLQRLFFPSPLEFDVGFQNSPLEWYCRRVAVTVWNWGNPGNNNTQVYDAAKGASFYNMANYGGSFALSNWMTTQARLCNCYDLAGLVQLGAGLLLDEVNGQVTELLDTRWVFQSPTGFVNLCLIYGWGGAFTYWPMGVNNPFFLTVPPQIFSSNPPTTPFANHAWVEISPSSTDPTQRTVLDVTTAIPDPSLNQLAPEYGAKSRDLYKSTHINVAADPNDQYTGNTFNNVRTLPQSNGNCYTNNDYWMTDGVFHYRLGVYSVDNMPPMPKNLGATNTPFAAHITEIVEIGRNPNAPKNPEKEFSNSILTVDRLVELIVEESMSLENQKLQVGAGSSLMQLYFDGLSIAQGVNYKLIVELYTFNDTSSALVMLTQKISGFEVLSPPSEHFMLPDIPLGMISIAHKSGEHFFVVHGNHFLSLAVTPKESVTDLLTAVSSKEDATVRTIQVMAKLAQIALSLDNYLAENFVGHEDYKLPIDGGDQDAEPVEMTVPLHERFTVSLKPGAQNPKGFSAVQGETANGSIVICTQVKASVGEEGSKDNVQVEFFGVKEGETEIAVHVTHGETLAPGTMKWKIKVGKQ